MVPKDDTWVSWAVLKSDGTNGTVEEAPSECIRTMGMPMVEALGNLASETLAGNCTARSNYIPDKGKGGHLGSGATNEQIIVSCEDRWLLDYLYKDSLMTLESFSAAHESMATAINNRVRRDMSALDGEVSFVEGSVWATEVCVDVDWVWLVYPGVLLILTAGLLVTTYLQCCQNRGKQPIWKSSILSILFYDIRTQGKEDRTGPNGEETPLLHLAELESLADRTMAHFSTDARRPGFVVEQEER
ncbi:hypothetical protein CkaCkLH20_04297 [Colletotrichum karsti]|uniref:Uncharacterized protein n=1 Tax=Colletotrichum karsti TaxID=1095194 RepID=A0A9P6I955_9PEZI|nr:uncharacterized protein CkaCkLH20_04297 [Colletotrichum karsti]KAF9878259.1 hypothetical protein CkaCkLH20_04297 [Colletotrichum karsti]